MPDRLRFFFAFPIVALFLTPLVLQAGGPVQANGESGVVWDISNNGAVTLTLDPGPLGKYDSAEAYGIVATAVGRWDTAGNSGLDIRIGGYFSNDINSPVDPVLSGSSSQSDGIVPIIFDQDASITDAYLGAGASAQVLGFATGFSLDGRIYTDGQVIMNGSNQNRNDARYITTLTHELGHLLGLSHSQSTMRTVTPIMYPSSAVGDLHPDDIAAIGTLYPSAEFTASVGGISGRILDVDGNPVSGVNVVAVDSATGLAFSTLTDYYSGGLPRFSFPPQKNGTFRFQGLPPATYFLRIEGINPEFTSGSRVASYDPPVHYEIVREWYNGTNEGAAMLADNLNDKLGIRVEAGAVTTDIDVVINDMTGLQTLSDYQDNGERSYGLPQTYQGVRSLAYAVRFTAPESGAPAFVRFKIYRFASLPEDGEAVITVYRNARTSDGDVPGDEIGSVTVPFSDLASNQLNDVWLHGLGAGLNFTKGDLFHIAIRNPGAGRLDLMFDRSEGESTTSYLDNADSEWHAFPIEGSNGGTRAGNLIMEVGYSQIAGGTSRVLVAANEDPLVFDSLEIGVSQTRNAIIRNIGNVNYRIDAVSLAGTDAAAFELGELPSLPATIEPGGSLTVAVTSRPDSEGPYEAELKYEGTVSTTTRLIGVGKSASVEALVSDIEFGQVLVDESEQKSTVAIVNRGTTQYAVGAGLLEGGGGFRLVSPSRTVILAPGDELPLTLAFEPTEVGEYSGTVGLSFLPARDSIRIRVSGEGVDEITGVQSDEKHTSGLRVSELSPNPAAETVELRIERDRFLSGPLLVSIVDVAGRRVLTEEFPMEQGLSAVTRTIDISALPAGSYLAIVSVGAERSVRNLRIVR